MSRYLQAAVAVAAMVPVSAGLAGVVFGPAMIGDVTQPNTDLDSHYRYMSGLLLGVGLGFWSCVPGIERKTSRVQLLGLIVVIGGLARAISLPAAGMLSAPMLFALAMELAVTPALCFWQWRVSRRYVRDDGISRRIS